MCLACVSSTPPAARLPSGRVSLVYQAYDGRRRSLAEFRGKPLIVSVVATWAGPALVEVERLRTIQRTYGDAVEVVILVLDEEPEMAAIFAETFDLPGAVGRVEEPERLIGEGGPFGPIGVVPTTVLLDAEGRIALRSDGPLPVGALEAALDALLAGGR